ncbi:MAG: HAD-IA family hydrolase [Gammaproteobacteria bacterium]|nr:HAD-IA family hydrolase [Gammaproteobacteria bacterium]
MPELVVFDFDGTLVDSAGRIVAAMQAAFAEHGLAIPAPHAVRAVIGLELGAACAALLPPGDRGRAPACATAYRRHYALLGAVATPLFAAARETLAALAGQGILLAIATGKSRAGLDRALADAAIAAYFVTTRSADEGPSKPHPGMLYDILTELDVRPSRAVMVGDTTFDLDMARAAGVPAIAAAYGAHPRARLLDCSPVAVIDALHELPRTLAALATAPLAEDQQADEKRSEEGRGQGADATAAAAQADR